MKKINKYLLLVLTIFSFTACDDYLDVKPKDRIIPTTGDDFRALLTSAYNGTTVDKSIVSFRTDEVKLDESRYDLSSVRDLYLWNDINPSKNTIDFAYQAYYKVIMYANHVIDKGGKATESTEKEINQIQGEAYLLRAYMYFSLVNMYGKPYDIATSKADIGVPLSLKIDSEANFIPNTVAEVYSQIMSDIAKGLSLINVDVYKTGLNYRFSKVAALSFLSRVYLYMDDYSNAKKYALEAMKYKSGLVDLVNNYSESFYKSSSIESILAIEKTVDSHLINSCFISDKMKKSFNQDKDKRFAAYCKVSKKNKNEFVINKDGDRISANGIRTAELYLILAECEAHLNKNLPKAKEYLNTLKKSRLKADFYVIEENRINAMDQSELINEIAEERFRELAFEGHRWFDLRRTTQPMITHTYNKKATVLKKNDPRYTIRFPKEAIDNNPYLK